MKQDRKMDILRKDNVKNIVIVCFIIVALLLFFFNLSVGYFANVFFSKGEEYFNGDLYSYSKAFKYYKKSVWLNDSLYRAHYQLARIYLVKNDLNNAKKEIDLELKYHPENKRSYYIRGLIDGYLKKYSEAQDDFRKFIEWSPDEWAGYMDLSWVYINDSKFQEALETTDEGLEKFPDHTWLLANKGLALYKLGRYEEARGALEKDKELAKKLTSDDWKRAYPGNDPNGAENGVKDIQGIISYNLTLVYKKLNNTEKYLEEVDYYLALFPADDARRNKIYDTL